MVDRFDCFEPLATGRETGEYVRYSDYAAIKAENERLTRELETASKLKRQYLYAANHWHERAERALAERAGGVKELAADLIELLRCIDQVQGRPATESVYGIYNPNSPFGRIVEKVRASVDALTTEPAAPEGQQEVVAWWVHDFHAARQPVNARGKFEAPTEYFYPAIRKDHARETARIMGATCSPLYTRPAEQAVTEDWREIKQHVQPRIADGYTAVAISKPGYWFVKGPGPAAAAIRALGRNA